MRAPGLCRPGRVALPVLAVLAAGMSLLLGGCDKKSSSTSTSGIAQVACDQSFERIMRQEIEVFEYIYPDASVMAYYVDEKAAIDSLMAMGDVKTAVAARKLTDFEKQTLEAHRKHVKEQRIAVDAIALITNPANNFDEPLTKAEIAKVLTGEITRWDQLGPSRMGKIDVIFEHQSSSTVKYMRDSLMQGRPFGPGVFAQATAQDVFDVVEKNPNALGILGVSWISADLSQADTDVELTAGQKAAALERNDTTALDFSRKVNVLKVRGDSSIVGYKPYQAYIFDGSYPLFRSIYMITTAPNGSIGHGFYSFVTGFQGQKLIQQTGVLPAIVRPRMVQVN